MAELNISQEEADSLLAMPKVKVDNKTWEFPTPGKNTAIPLTSIDERENFTLDVSRGRINIAKIKYQNRTRQVVVLARLELDGPDHTNPDGEIIPCPHIHLYREGYADKWAFALPSDVFSRPDDFWVTLEDFLAYCNITDPPSIQRVI